jgi:hypothetical protein
VTHSYEAVCTDKNGGTVATAVFDTQSAAVSWAVSYGNSHLSTVFGYHINQLS